MLCTHAIQIVKVCLHMLSVCMTAANEIACLPTKFTLHIIPVQLAYCISLNGGRSRLTAGGMTTSFSN